MNPDLPTSFQPLPTGRGFLFSVARGLDFIDLPCYSNPIHVIFVFFVMLQLGLQIAQIVLSILLILVVLLQSKGDGLGAGFGGSSSIISTRRGVDLFLHKATIGIAALFFLTALAHLFV